MRGPRHHGSGMSQVAREVAAQLIVPCAAIVAELSCTVSHSGAQALRKTLLVVAQYIADSKFCPPFTNNSPLITQTHSVTDFFT